MFLVTVISRALYCGSSYAYWTSLAEHAAASAATFNVYANARPAVVFCDVLNRYKAACYLTGISLFVTILLIGSGWSFIRSSPPPLQTLNLVLHTLNPKP